MIEAKNISAVYGKKPVLRDFSLTLKEGELTVLVGPNGSGKSTFFKTLVGILPCSAGEIRLDDTDLAGLSPTARARRIAYLSQEKQTPNITVEQLVLYGRYPHLNFPRRYRQSDREIVRSVLKTMHMEHLAECLLPSLSGGMRQNAYIAMALAQDTDYILLDEPTTFLDVSHQLALMERLQTLTAKGKGVVAVMHDLPLAFSCADKVAVLREGTLCACDRPEELCRSGVIREVFGVDLVPHRDENDGECRYFLRPTDR